MQLFYYSYLNDDLFALPEEESKHIIRVLRKQVGDNLDFTDGKGCHAVVEITAMTKKVCQLKVVSRNVHEKPAPKLTICVAPTKNMDKTEWFAEKATEIGIDKIVPIQCKHSERKNIKSDRLKKIVTSAMKQSLSFHLPEIEELTPFTEAIKNSTGKVYICHLTENAKALFDVVEPNEDTTVFIGPEGDFTEEEISFAKENGVECVTLGNKRLRTETAALVACHTIQLKNA